MADSVSKKKRSWNMSHIRSKNTVPELKVLRILRRLGYEIKCHDKTLPGTPDFVLSSNKTVIFVNGCFWHRHACSRAAIPKSNKAYWEAKFAGNVRTMHRNQRRLNKLGWRVRNVWECRIKKCADLTGYIKSILK